MSKQEDDPSSRGPSHDFPEEKEEITSEAELLTGATGITTAEPTVKPKTHIAKVFITEQEEQPEPETSLNVETFRQRFRAYRYSNFDGPREAYAQLHELLLKWIQPERKTGEQILEMIALEQFIEILPDKVKLWVQEHRPETRLVSKLPYPLIIGRDFPNFLSLLPRQKTERPVVAVTTRAQAKKADASEGTWE
uniref:SCAN box domain-containing protein n=1 Tax=Xenopus tropicalis TaxID=8364 RepID=A0A803KDU2_XENTR